MQESPAMPTVFTDRFDETLAFYRWLGFRVVEADPRSIELAWPDDRSCRIAIRKGAERATVLSVLRLEVADIEAQYRRIGAVRTLASKLREDGPGRRVFAVADPNGVVLEFVGSSPAAGPPPSRPVLYPMVMAAG